LASLTHLADACALLAYFGIGAKAMSNQGLEAMRGLPVVSVITVWELVHKANLGKLPPLPVINGTFVGYLVASGFRLEKLEVVDGERAASLPPIHKDPMDRMLIATAQRTGLTIITCDTVFSTYGVATVW